MHINKKDNVLIILKLWCWILLISLQCLSSINFQVTFAKNSRWNPEKWWNIVVYNLTMVLRVHLRIGHATLWKKGHTKRLLQSLKLQRIVCSFIIKVDFYLRASDFSRVSFTLPFLAEVMIELIGLPSSTNLEHT